MEWLLTTNPGIEDVVEAEAGEALDAQVLRRSFGMRGRVLIATDAPLERILGLRSVYHVVRYLHRFELSAAEDGLATLYDELYALDIPEMADARTFRVTGHRSGTHAFTSMDIQRVAGQALVDRYGTEVDLETYDVDVRCDVIGLGCEVGVQVTRESLHQQRFERPFNHPAATKAPLAYALLRLAGLQAGETLLDPCCGGGTIPIEAAQAWGAHVEIHAGEIHERFLDGARRNAEAAGVADRITFCSLDARALAQHDWGGPIDRIVTNPPYGIKMGKQSYIKGLYSAFIDDAAAVLAPGGRLVVITQRADTLRRALFATNRLTPVAERVVESGGLYPNVFIIERVAPA